MKFHEKLRAELINSMESLFSKDSSNLLLSALKSSFPWLQFALVVNWIPEQCEDIYWVLIDGNRVATVEIPRLDSGLTGVSINVSDLYLYRSRDVVVTPEEYLKILGIVVDLRLKMTNRYLYIDPKK